MKATRKKVALAVLALAAPAAFAQGVTIAGRMDMSVQYIDNGVETTKRADSGTYTASRLVFRGTEDLGGGLGALFYLEHRLNADTGAQASAAKFWNAGSYVGLSGKDWGTVTLGRQYVPIFWPFLFGDDTGPLRLHTYSAVQTVQRSNFARVAAAASPIKTAGTLDSIGGGIYSLSITSAFEDNMVVYKTPSMGGLTLTAAIAAPEGFPAGGGKVYGGNAEYRNGPLYAGYAFNQKEGRVPAGANATQKVTEHVVTAMYTVSPAFNIWGNVHPWKFTSNGTKLDGHDWMVGGTWKSGAHWVWANYATKSIGSGCTNCDSSGFGIGYHYLLSKRTELYASWASVSNEANSANTLNGFAPGAVGKDLRGLAAGIAVTF